MHSFPEWLRNRSQEAPAAEQLALVIAGAGAGISQGRIEKAVPLPSETLNDLLRVLAATGQVRLLKLGGETVDRAAG